MTDEIYFDESLDSIIERFKANNIDPKRLFKDKSVLDAGCGSGKFACAIARLGAKKVTGIDLSNNAINFAKQQSQKAELSDKMVFKSGSVCNIQFPDNTFDFVWSNGVVHHTTEQQITKDLSGKYLES